MASNSLSLREVVREDLVAAIADLDDNEGFGKIILRLATTIARMAKVYAMTDQ